MKYVRTTVSICLGLLCCVVLGARNTQTARGASIDCSIIVPSHPLSAIGLATPYQLGNGCHESNPNESAYVQAAILDRDTGAISIYEPVVVDAGTTPSVAPPVPTLPTHSIEAIWFGFNGDRLKLRGGDGGHCINGADGSLFGQMAYCNAPDWFDATNRLIKQGKITVPQLGTAIDGLPCPTTRDASIVDQDPSDNLPVAGNGSDEGLVARRVDAALHCTPWLVPDISHGGILAPSLATNELQAASWQSAPVMLVPSGDPMVLKNGAPDHAKLVAYRRGVDQPTSASGSTLAFCSNIISAGIPRLILDMPYTSVAPSPFPLIANSLYTFLAQRLTATFAILGCGNAPFVLTYDANGVVIGATL